VKRRQAFFAQARFQGMSAECTEHDAQSTEYAAEFDPEMHG
jgi:hypothetical protein